MRWRIRYQIAAFVGALLLGATVSHFVFSSDDFVRLSVERVAAFSVVLALTGLLAIFWSKQLTAPLMALRHYMDELAAGAQSLEIKGRDARRLGPLAESFNKMSQELDRRSAELQRMSAQLVQSEKLSAIGELSASLAHEVKNPMVGIVGFSQLGLEATDLEECQEYFRLIESDAQRANGILQNLLEFARPPDVLQQALDMNSVVQAAMRLCSHQLSMSGVTVESTFAEALPPIHGNENQLRQVLLNLMMNAGQAMEGANTRRLSVSTGLAADDGGVFVRVADTGPGMPDAVKKRIFEPFFTTKPRGKGTGLGLSISASIVAEHRGVLAVESEEGVGTTFVVRLPPRSAHGELGAPPSRTGEYRVSGEPRSG